MSTPTGGCQTDDDVVGSWLKHVQLLSATIRIVFSSLHSLKHRLLSTCDEADDHRGVGAKRRWAFRRIEDP